MAAVMKACRWRLVGVARLPATSFSRRGSQLPRKPLSMPVRESADAAPQPHRLTRNFRLDLDSANPCLLEMQYAVRGPLLLRAMEIEKELRQGEHYPFKKIIYCNIGDVQAMGKSPITYIRQLITVCLSPYRFLVSEHRWNVAERVQLLLEALGERDPSVLERLTSAVAGLSEEEKERVREVVDEIPRDVKERAEALLRNIQGHSLGTYTNSQGVALIREHVADFITRRDATVAPSNPNHIFLLNGASDGIKSMIFACVNQAESCGVMIPIPQYPIYTASIAEFGAKKIEYYLDEANDWAVDVDDMRRRIQKAQEHCQPRILVVINPGNPTGQCLSEANMKEIVSLCQSEGLVLLADEVYQDNIYDPDTHFTSFRKIVLDMEAHDVQLVSFNSISKGYIGECGVRGGYMELVGFDNDIQKQIYKLFSTKLCPNTVGQVVLYAMVHPPVEGDPSYELYKKERDDTLQALQRKADMVWRRFQSIPHVSCNQVKGAMYAYPRIDLPHRAIEEARRRGIAPDVFYCMQFLEQKGVCIVPGSGFGQERGTWHFRTTILPSETSLIDMLERFEDFHLKFINKYS